MAGEGTKRIIDLTEAAETQNGDYFAIDSTGRGTRKLPAGSMATAEDLSAEETARQTADATLDGKITAETQARLAADNEIGEQITALDEKTEADAALIQNPTKTLSGALCSFADGANMPMVACTAEIVPQQSGTGTPSPDNVRPISGWESVVLGQSGENLIDAVNLSPTSSARWINTDGVAVKSNVQYALSVTASKSLSNRFYVIYADKATITQSETTSGKTFLTAQFVDSNTLTFTFTASNDAYIYLYAGDVVGDFTLSEVQIELGSTATAYEPYTGTTTTVNLGRTVYGGTLDVVSGELTVDRFASTYNGSEAWALYSSSDTTNVFRLLNAITAQTDQSLEISSHFAFNSKANQANVSRANTFVQGASKALFIQVEKTLATDADAFKSWLASNPVTVVYGLQQPQTYTLTPTEVSTLLGENNVWADAGAVEVTYRRDITIALSELEQAIISLGANV